MRQQTQIHDSGTTTASTMTLRGLAATAGMGATLLALLAAPMLTLGGVAGVLAVASGLRLRDASHRTRQLGDAERRDLHRLLTDATTHP